LAFLFIFIFKIYLQDLLGILLKLLEGGVEVEVTARCLLFLLEIHHGPILANQVSIPYLVISKSHILMYKPFLFRCK
jgi:hypothetical protein